MLFNKSEYSVQNIIKYSIGAFFVIGVICTICIVRCNRKQIHNKEKRFVYFQKYQRTFNDINDKHIGMAQKWGVKPEFNDDGAVLKSGRLKKLRSCRFYELDELTHSEPYLVPRAHNLLKTIGKNFKDSLNSKNLPKAKIIVTSVLRTKKTIKHLKKKNINASSNSAHIYGTTFDIAYTRFHGGDVDYYDKMKSTLAEVLQDLRKADKCYVKYEIKQGCFHITTR